MNKRLLSKYNKTILLDAIAPYNTELNSKDSHKKIVHYILTDSRLNCVSFGDLELSRIKINNEFKKIRKKVIKKIKKKKTVTLYKLKITTRWPNDPCHFNEYEETQVVINRVEENGDIIIGEHPRERRFVPDFKYMIWKGRGGDYIKVNI